MGQLRPANIVHLSEKWADMALGSLHGGFTPNPCYARAFVGLLPSNLRGRPNRVDGVPVVHVAIRVHVEHVVRVASIRRAQADVPAQ